MKRMGGRDAKDATILMVPGPFEDVCRSDKDGRKKYGTVIGGVSQDDGGLSRVMREGCRKMMRKGWRRTMRESLLKGVQ